MKYMQFAKQLGLTEEHYNKLYEEFLNKFPALEVSEKEDLANFQVLKYLKKLQMTPMLEIDAVYLGNGGLRENDNGKFRVVSFYYNNQIFNSFVNEDLFNKYADIFTEMRKIKIKCSVGQNKLFFNEFTTFKSDATDILNNKEEFIKRELSTYIEKSLNNLFNENRNFVIIKSDILSLDVFNTRAQAILCDDTLSPEKTILMWLDINNINFIDGAKDLILIGNTYIDKNGNCVFNPINMIIPDKYKKTEVEKISESTEVETFL